MRKLREAGAHPSPPPEAPLRRRRSRKRSGSSATPTSTTWSRARNTSSRAAGPATGCGTLSLAVVLPLERIFAAGGAGRRVRQVAPSFFGGPVPPLRAARLSPVAPRLLHAVARASPPRPAPARRRPRLGQRRQRRGRRVRPSPHPHRRRLLLPRVRQADDASRRRSPDLCGRSSSPTSTRTTARARTASRRSSRCRCSPPPAPWQGTRLQDEAGPVRGGDPLRRAAGGRGLPWSSRS